MSLVWWIALQSKFRPEGKWRTEPKDIQLHPILIFMACIRTCDVSVCTCVWFTHFAVSNPQHLCHVKLFSDAAPSFDAQQHPRSFSWLTEVTDVQMFCFFSAALLCLSSIRAARRAETSAEPSVSAAALFQSLLTRRCWNNNVSGDPQPPRLNIWRNTSTSSAYDIAAFRRGRLHHLTSSKTAQRLPGPTGDGDTCLS